MAATKEKSLIHHRLWSIVVLGSMMAILIPKPESKTILHISLDASGSARFQDILSAMHVSIKNNQHYQFSDECFMKWVDALVHMYLTYYQASLTQKCIITVSRGSHHFPTS